MIMNDFAGRRKKIKATKFRRKAQIKNAKHTSLMIFFGVERNRKKIIKWFSWWNDKTRENNEKPLVAISWQKIVFWEKKKDEKFFRWWKDEFVPLASFSISVLWSPDYQPFFDEVCAIWNANFLSLIFSSAVDIQFCNRICNWKCDDMQI